MRKAILLILVFLLLLAAPSAFRYLQFYNLSQAERAAPPVYEPAQIAAVPTPPSNLYMDEPTMGQGMILLDQAHRNQVGLEDLTYLNGRLAARGYSITSYSGGDLAAQLRPASAFITIAPLDGFSAAERQALRRFVERGGRLLLVGEPTRFGVMLDESNPFFFDFIIETNQIPLNSLASEFDLVFNGDYLYNTVENEGNFRNILLRQGGFATSQLLEGVEQLVFYSAHSIQVGPTAVSLITADDNTWSSATGRPGGLVLAASDAAGRVLALGDLHFLTEPYYTVYDNSRFISQIADFLTESTERAPALADFPYLYRQSLNLVFTGGPELGAAAFGQIIALQNAFNQIDMPVTLAAAPQPEHDVLYVGLYNQADDVAQLLESLGVTFIIEPPIFTAAELAGAWEEDEEQDEEKDEEEETAVRLIQSSLGSVQMSGTALAAWVEEEDGRRSVIVLAASAEGLFNIVDRMLGLIPQNASDPLSGCLVQDPIALCPTNVTNEEVEAELITSGLAATPPPSGGGAPTPPTETPAPIADLGADLQGEIELGGTVEGVLEEDTKHAWHFSGGPVIIDIRVSGDENLDLVLELFDPQNERLVYQDSGFSGDPEEIVGQEIADNGRYTIVVSDYFGRTGSYSLTISEGEEARSGEGIFIFVDDDDTPLNGGISSGNALLALLEPDYAVTVWTASNDGPLSASVLDGYDLLIWDTGDYLNEMGFFDPDTSVILDYVDNGGRLFITGSAPAVFGEQTLAPLVDVEVSDEDPVLSNGLTPGDIFTLDQTYDAILSDLVGSVLDDDTPVIFLRGPESDAPGAIIGFAVDEAAFDQRTVFLLFPFAALPQTVQPILLGNILAWLDLPVRQP
jgi:hypothetical protein